MNLADDISIYLPKYLSSDSQEELFTEIKNFPSNDPNIFFTILDEKNVFQGDAIREFPFISLPNPEIKNTIALVLSNTCDIEPDNKRFFPSHVIYCPLVELEKYVSVLENNKLDKQKIDNHIKDIKNQRITQIMYFPKGRDLNSEYIAFFDRVNHISINFITPDFLQKNRTFSLSNFGFYLLLLKLSIHFSRVRENVDRKI